MGVAFAGVLQVVGASLATVKSRADDTTAASLQTATTTDRARLPGCKWADDAVHRTAVVVAALSLTFVGTLLAAVTVTKKDTPGTFLGAIFAATTRAGAPSAEFGHLAIDGTAVDIAGLRVSQTDTAASVLGNRCDGTGALGGAGTTSLGTCAPCGPFRHDTVDGACWNVAGTFAAECDALLSAEL